MTEKIRPFCAINQRLEDKIEKLKEHYDEKSEQIYAPLSNPFVEQRKNIDRFSTLYSFESPFEILHADITDIRFLEKSAVDPKYCLLFVDLLTLKTEKQRSIKQKIALFYEDISEKSKTEKEMRIQTDREFEQNEIKRLNKKYKVHMFYSKVRGGKAFAVEQKIREFKKLLFRIKAWDKRLGKKIRPNKLIERRQTI